MSWNPFKSVGKNFLGIDIGTSSMKVVELSRHGDRIKLENYGEASSQTLYEKPFRTIDKNTLLLSSQEIAKALSAIFEEAKIAEKKAVFSIPDFATFFIDFTLPAMSKDELPEAVKYEARQYIPMPLSEVVLDWSIIDGEIGKSKKKGTPLKILSVVVPLEFINQYQEVASLAGVKIQAIEAEAFALLRALSFKDKEAVCIIDIGAQSTTVNVCEGGILKKSHSFDISGNEFSKVIADSLRIDQGDSENLKKDSGLNEGEDSARKILLPLIDHIVEEARKIFRSFASASGREVGKVILAGGSARMPGLKEYFAQQLGKETIVAEPFKNIFYPPILEDTMNRMGPSFAIAVGTALRGLDLK